MTVRFGVQGSALSGFAAVTERIALGAGVVLLERLPTRTARAVMLPARVGGTLETMRAYLPRRYGTQHP